MIRSPETSGAVGDVAAEGGIHDELAGDGGTVDHILTGDNDPSDDDFSGAIAHLLFDGPVADETPDHGGEIEVDAEADIFASLF
jgi:hypothetical protein